MKILYHHRTQAEDGQAVHIRALLRAFEELGHDVLEVGLVRHYPGSSSAPACTPEDAGSAGRARWGWVTRLPRFAREAAEYAYSGVAKNRILTAAVWFEPDFVYERNAFANTGGVLAARKLGKPFVLEVNAPLVLELTRTRGLVFGSLARRLEDFVYSSADRVCVVSEALRDLLLEGGVDAERILVTPNGVCLADYDYADRDEVRRRARADLGLATDRDGAEPASERGTQDVVVGFVGYYRRWHRLDVVLRAMRAPELSGLRLVLVGEGPEHPELVRLAGELGLGGRVVFAGPCPHARVPSLLPAFDLAVVPAINEYASPLKLHEYMAAGLPVVAPDQANLREALTHGRDGWLVPAGDVDAMAAALGRLSGDAELREELGRAARATVKAKDLTWTCNARRVVEAVAALKRGRGA